MVECAALEKLYICKGIVGSNPTSSAANEVSEEGEQTNCLVCEWEFEAWSDGRV